MPARLALLDQPDRVRAALTPLRRTLLERLHRPASATEIAAELNLPRQRVNYHLRALEAAGLVALVETRPRRGCLERVLGTTASTFVVDPAVVGGRPAVEPAAAVAQDRFAAEQLVTTAASVVREVTRMQNRAQRQGERLITFTLEAELAFATPAAFERFTADLTAFVARAAIEHQPAPGARAYRIVAGAHPAPRRAHPRSRRAG